MVILVTCFGGGGGGGFTVCSVMGTISSGVSSMAREAISRVILS